MPPLDDPFAVVLQRNRRAARSARAIIFVDFHAEATSEKIAMGWHLDGKVTAVVGTHTHVQTADERILPERHRVPDRRRHDGAARFNHRRGGRAGARPLPHRPAGAVRDRDRQPAAERRRRSTPTKQPGRATDIERLSYSSGRARRELARMMSDLFDLPFRKTSPTRPAQPDAATRRAADPRPPRAAPSPSSRSASAICSKTAFFEVWVEGELSNCRALEHRTSVLHAEGFRVAAAGP